MKLTSDRVLSALSSVKDPDLGQDLVTLGMIRDLQIAPDNSVSLRVVLTTPACPLKAKIEADVRLALQQIEGIGTLQIKMDSQVRNQGRAQHKNSIEGVEYIVAVSSGKGGVGKSTVASNLAMALAMDGARVGLMDADIYGPNQPTMMGVVGAPTIEKDASGREFFIPPSAHGVKVMSMGFLIQGDQPMIWRGPMLHNVVNQFCHMVNWGTLDYLVIDMPPGTGDVQLSLAQLIPITGAVMVSTPQEVAMQDVRKAIHMWEKVKVPILGFVENMSSFECPNCRTTHPLFGEGGGKRLEQKFHAPLLAQLPIQQSIREGGDEGVPQVMQNPDSKATRTFRDLARTVAQQVSILGASASSRGAGSIEIGKFS